VLAYAVSADGQRVAYLLAGKLVRSPAQATLLRGLSLRVLHLPTMALGKPVPISGDVKQVQLWFSSAPVLQVTDAASKTSTLTLVDDRFDAAAAATRWRGEFVLVTGSGVQPGKRRITRAHCGFALAMQKDSNGLWGVLVSRPGSKSFSLDTRYGAGLAGLPFPEGAGQPRPASKQSVGKP
jgi:hypothetical protein